MNKKEINKRKDICEQWDISIRKEDRDKAEELILLK